MADLSATLSKLFDRKPNASAEEIHHFFGSMTKAVGYFTLTVHEGKNQDAILVHNPAQAKPVKVRGGIEEYALLLVELALHSVFLRVLSLMGIGGIKITTPDHYTGLGITEASGNVTFQTKAFRINPEKPFKYTTSKNQFVEYPAGEIVGVIGIGAFFTALLDRRDTPIFIGTDVEIYGVPVTQADLTGEPSQQLVDTIQEAVRFALAKNSAFITLLQRSVNNSPAQIRPPSDGDERAEAAVLLNVPMQAIEMFLVLGEGIVYVPYDKDEGLFCSEGQFTPWTRPPNNSVAGTRHG